MTDKDGNTGTGQEKAKDKEEGLDLGESASAAHLKSLIRQLEAEREAHDVKFANNPAHSPECLKRFDKAIAQLQEELAKVEQ
ncbi:MAG TPA: hypothetical protein V6D17_20655 [Candidatus Obscuribacterales bacterium]